MSTLAGFCLNFLVFVTHFSIVPSTLYEGTEIKEIFRKNPDLVPWMGFLLYKDYDDIDSFAVIILIAPQFALGYAAQINSINRQYLVTETRAIFPGKSRGLYNSHWELSVKDFFVHPEFKEDTINSVGLLHVHSLVGTVPPSYWVSIDWPEKFHEYNSPNLLMIGFVERNNTIEQVYQRMDDVDLSTCKDFYVSEKMDYRYFWPTNFLCFRERYSQSSCVYGQGLAVFDYTSRDLILLGLSTMGPGCSLPSRFIEFYPYTQWVQNIITDNTPRNESKFVRIDDEIPDYDEPSGYIETRRAVNQNVTKKGNLTEKMWFDDLNRTVVDFDEEMLTLLENRSISFKKHNKTKLWHRGNCDNLTILELLYQEQGYIMSPTPSYRVSRGLYAFSLFDMRYVNVSCIIALVHTPGIGEWIRVYKTDLFYQLPISYHIKYKQKVSLKQESSASYAFLKSPYALSSIPEKLVTTFELNFEFIKFADIHVKFYATQKEHVEDYVRETTTPEPMNYTKIKHQTYKGLDIYKKKYKFFFFKY